MLFFFKCVKFQIFNFVHEIRRLILPAPDYLWLTPNCKQEKTKLSLINIDIWLVRDLHPTFSSSSFLQWTLRRSHRRRQHRRWSTTVAGRAGPLRQRNPGANVGEGSIVGEDKVNVADQFIQNSCMPADIFIRNSCVPTGYIYPKFNFVYRIYLSEIDGLSYGYFYP